MNIHFDLPKDHDTIIKVIGVGGGGCNAVNHMYNEGITGVSFIICNTDAQAIAQSPVPRKITLGPQLTDGRGAGSQPEVGKNATIESIDEIKKALGQNTKMVFITAGMGGGTGTGGAPVVARIARELGILTVGIVTAPFGFEGRKRLQQAQNGIEEMKQNVDTLILISNEKLRELFGTLTVSAAFANADNVVTTAAKGIAEIITVPGYVNVDFEDVNSVMKNSGVAVMGTGVADGEDRAQKAIRQALESPLLNNNDIRGAKNILLHITSGKRELLMDEISDITDYIAEAVGCDAEEVIWGNSVDMSLENQLAVTIIATGFSQDKNEENSTENDFQKKQQTATTKRNQQQQQQQPIIEQQPVAPPKQERIVVSLEDEPVMPNVQQPLKRTPEQPTTSPDENMKIIIERRRRLQGLSNQKLNENLSELEREPAYKRRNIQLDDTPHSSETNLSKYQLQEDEHRHTEIKRRNTFLHDNPD